MDPANQVHYPRRLILELWDLWGQFVADTHGLPIHFNDRHEIVTQILEVFIDFGTNGEARLQALPDPNRIVDPIYQNRGSVQFLRLQAAVQRLAQGIHARLQEIGGLRSGAAGSGYGFPYYVYQFLGDDVILDYLPY